jgi:cation:H+ antiporter
MLYSDIPFLVSLAFLVLGLWTLTWSANRFVDASGALATNLGVPPFIIGMVVIGFGTSAPELAVSAISAASGHSEIALGNAWGSNIYNIAVILGVAAIINPIIVRPRSAFYSSAMLIAISLVSGALAWFGGGLSRFDAVVLLVLFSALLPLSCWLEKQSGSESNGESKTVEVSYPWLVVLASLALLVGSSHILVWGAVDLARHFHVSELLIGLTIVAAGTSLPELASAVAAARKGQHDFVVGNIVGSNFFNALAVVGLSGVINPFNISSAGVFARDLPVMIVLSLSIAVFAFKSGAWKSQSQIGKWKGVLWVLSFLGYLTMLIFQESVQH